MGDRNFRFVEIIMGVILGVVLVATGDVLVKGFNFQNYRAVLLIIGLLIFAEMYFGLVRYHIAMEVDYSNLYLFFDIFIGLFFITFVELIQTAPETTPQEINRNIQLAMVICAILFILLFLRQIIPYRQIQDLETKLERLRINKKRMQIPIVTPLFGIVICICIYLAETNSGFLKMSTVVWSWLGIVVFALYAFSEHVAKLEFKFSFRT